MLNSSLVDVGEVEAIGARVDSGALVGANEQRDKELSEPALLGVAHPCIVTPVGAVGDLVWLLRVVETRWGCLQQGAIAEDGEKRW